MKTRYLITFYFALICNTAFAQPAAVPVKPCVFEWCSAVLPKTAGEKVTGKDNCGNYCSKHGIAVAAPTVPPLPAKPETAIVPKEEVIAQPAKDLLGQAAVSVTLAQDEQGRPVLQAICPVSGFNEYDLKALELGFKQKVVTRGKETFIIYEK